MILYQLSCNDEHTFEAWFRDGAAFDQQVRTGHVECPYCGSTQVAKAPMAPHIAGAAKPESLSEADINAASNTRAHEVAQQILDAVGKVKEYAEENCENVGEDFADEARKIHDGKAPERGIYGQTTQEEAADLEDEGIDFIRIPASSRRND